MIVVLYILYNRYGASRTPQNAGLPVLGCPGNPDDSASRSIVFKP